LLKALDFCLKTIYNSFAVKFDKGKLLSLPFSIEGRPIVQKEEKIYE